MFVIVQRIDNDITYPLVISRSVNMHPLTVIVVVIIGANLAGLIGMLLAIPITAIIKVTISEFMWGLRNYRME
jgi:predicted PurR-regulated permease PerM